MSCGYSSKIGVSFVFVINDLHCWWCHIVLAAVQADFYASMHAFNTRSSKFPEDACVNPCIFQETKEEDGTPRFIEFLEVLSWLAHISSVLDNFS